MQYFEMDLIYNGMKIKSGKKKNPVSCAANKKVHSKQFLLESNVLFYSNLCAQFQKSSLNVFTTGSYASFVRSFVCLSEKKKNPATSPTSLH